MLSVAIRSAAGFAVAKANSEVPAVLWGLTLAAVAGKALGGFLADWLGWIRTSVITTLVAASLLGLANANSAAIVVGTIFLQVTMSVTLLAIYRAFPEEPGLAFGLPTLALLVGALPSLVFSNAWITPPLTLLVALLASALCLAIGLPPIVGIRNREAAQPPSPAAVLGQRPSVSRPVGGKSEMRNPKSETNSKPKGPKLSPP
jgi:hypothetical protein